VASYPHGTSKQHVDPDDRVENILVRGKLMYQTHAYLIRKPTAVFVLDKLKRGLAADAALVSWTRTAPDRCFAFRPRQILFQPGGASRWKDSDIFVEGAEFKRKANKAAKHEGKVYSFAPKFRNSFRSLQSEGVELHMMCRPSQHQKLNTKAVLPVKRNIRRRRRPRRTGKN